MNEKDLMLTDLDYAIGDRRMQMLKAAIPYMEIPQQRVLSMFIKWRELVRTMEFFNENGDGMMSVCSMEKGHTSPADMLAAVKPYAGPGEQEIIDLLVNAASFKGSRNGAGGRSPFSMDQLISLLPPDTQSRLETVQLMMQTLGQV